LSPREAFFLKRASLQKELDNEKAELFVKIGRFIYDTIGDIQSAGAASTLKVAEIREKADQLRKRYELEKDQLNNMLENKTPYLYLKNTFLTFTL